MALTAGLCAASMLGVAVAEAPTAAPVREVSVEGVATVPIGQFDTASAATAVYREAMADALNDGQTKATFLASKTGSTLGPVQSIVEGGGNIGCSGETAEGETNYPRYEGEEPDFGYGAAVAERASAPAVAPSVTRHAKPRHKKKRAMAKTAGGVSCTLSTGVSIAYAMN